MNNLSSPSPISFLKLRRRLTPAAAALLLALFGAIPVRAAAAVNCTYDPTTKVLQVNASDGQFAYVSRDGSNIVVADHMGNFPCSGGTPTVSNTDTVNITGSSGNNFLYIRSEGGRFAPGATPELGKSDEIEFNVDLLGPSGDLLNLTGLSNARFGAKGFNLNAGESTGKDVDVEVITEATVWTQYASTPTIISGAGGAGTGAPYPHPLTISGSAGADTLVGGSDDDYLGGLGGADLLAGGPAGTDQLIGFEGRDTATFAGANGVVASLATDTASDDGTGFSDVFDDVENLIGSSRGDDLTGSRAKNKVAGGGGNDLLFGLRGDDRLLGESGRDQLHGEGGADSLNGGAGRRDLCIGGPGRDELHACER